MATCIEVIKQRVHLDHLVKWYTAFTDFADLLNSHPSYRPSCNCVRNKAEDERLAMLAIADAYDAEMEKRGDQRRAYRY